MINQIQFSGKNLEDAINEAAKHFSVDKAFVCYKVTSHSQGGFLSKIFSSKVQIEAWLETAKEDLEQAARDAVKEALTGKKSTATKKSPSKTQTLSSASFPHQTSSSEGLSVQDPKVKSLLKEYNSLFFSAFELSSENYSTEFAEGQIIVHVEDEYLEGLLTKSDRLSLAYEHVLKRITQKKLGDLNGRARLDAGSSSEKREERLIGIAKSLAQKVQKTGRSMVISSKSSQERKTIHLALDGFPGIGTRSVGMGDKRRLVIYSLEKSESHTKRPSKNGHQKKRLSQPSHEKQND